MGLSEGRAQGRHSGHDDDQEEEEEEEEVEAATAAAVDFDVDGDVVKIVAFVHLFDRDAGILEGKAGLYKLGQYLAAASRRGRCACDIFSRRSLWKEWETNCLVAAKEKK